MITIAHHTVFHMCRHKNNKRWVIFHTNIGGQFHAADIRHLDIHKINIIASAIFNLSLEIICMIKTVNFTLTALFQQPVAHSLTDEFTVILLIIYHCNLQHDIFPFCHSSDNDFNTIWHFKDVVSLNSLFLSFNSILLFYLNQNLTSTEIKMLPL